MLSKLDYLHDCSLLEFKYDSSRAGDRQLLLLVKVDAQVSLPEWEGCLLRISLLDVYLFRCTVWGHTTSYEEIDRWREGVSQETESDLKRGIAIGLNVPPLKFTVSFHTGSYFEIVCKELVIEILENDN